MPTSEYFGAYSLGLHAYSGGCFGSAALHFLEARRIADRYSDRILGFKALAWAADSAMRGPNHTRALALLFEATAQPHVGMPEAEVWAVNRTLFDYYLDRKLDGTKALSQINRLSSLSAENLNRRASEVHLCSARYAHKIGDWDSALCESERAWSSWIDVPCALVHSEACDFAIRAALRLGRQEDARRWLDVWSKTDKELPDMRLRHATAALHLAIVKLNLNEIENLCERNEEESLGVQGNELIDSDEAFVRAVLLQQRHGDPNDRFHPARARLRIRRVHMAWLRVDYRLACVSWAASIQPKDDDYWWINSDMCPTRAKLRNQADFRARVSKAQLAIDRAMKWAKVADARFGCDWRQKDFCERQRRLNAIVQAVA